jgi:hypothetical protein
MLLNNHPCRPDHDGLVADLFAAIMGFHQRFPWANPRQVHPLPDLLAWPLLRNRCILMIFFGSSLF